MITNSINLRRKLLFLPCLWLISAIEYQKTDLQMTIVKCGDVCHFIFGGSFNHRCLVHRLSTIQKYKNTYLQTSETKSQRSQTLQTYKQVQITSVHKVSDFMLLLIIITLFFQKRCPTSCTTTKSHGCRGGSDKRSKSEGNVGNGNSYLNRRKNTLSRCQVFPI